MIKAILIDDEQLALTTLQHKLAQFPNVHIVHSYLGQEFQLDDLYNIDVDVIFLDIEMGELTGLDIADSIQSTFPTIQLVFVTAYPEYAVQAFEVNSLDYLLKPVTTKRLQKTLARIMNSTEQVKELSTQESTVVPSFTVHCFKEFRCSVENVPVPFKTVKVKELLAYFVLHRDTPVHRDILIEALWPDQDYKKSKINLHTCLSHLRKLLSSYGYSNCISLVNHSYIFSLNYLSCDLHDFQIFMQSLETVDATSISYVDEVVELYTGSLFELNHYDWASPFALQLSNDYVQMLEKTVQYYASVDKNKMLYYLQLLLPFFPYDDEKIGQCMSLLSEQGCRNEAIKLFVDFKNKLENDLNVSPSPKLEQLYESIAIG